MFVGFMNMESEFAIFTLADMGLLLGIIHTARQSEQQLKAEFVPVKLKNDTHLIII